MISWTASQRNDLFWRKIGRHCKKFSFSLVFCKGRQCAKNGALVNWISCVMILQYVLVFCFGLATASTVQNMEFCGNQTMDWLYILLQKVLVFAGACKCGLRQSGEMEETAPWAPPKQGPRLTSGSGNLTRRHLNKSPVSKQRPPRLFTNRNQNKVKIQELTESRASCENRPLRARRLNFADEEETLWKTCKYPAIFWDCKSLC